MQNGQEILLSITIADDDMIWHVHMFPEVMFMDTIANTNRQKRDLFLMVVKDASVECFIGNTTLLPCGQLWMFTTFYRYFFYQLLIWAGDTVTSTPCTHGQRLGLSWPI